MRRNLNNYNYVNSYFFLNAKNKKFILIRYENYYFRMNSLRPQALSIIC